MDRTAQESAVSASAIATGDGAAGGLTPAAIDALASAGDYAGISKPNLSPDPGSLLRAELGPTAKATSCMTRPDAATSTSLAASRPPRVGHHHPAVTQAIK